MAVPRPTSDHANAGVYYWGNAAGAGGSDSTGAFGQAEAHPMHLASATTTNTLIGAEHMWQNGMTDLINTGNQSTLWDLSAIPNLGSTSMSSSLQRYDGSDHTTSSHIPINGTSLWSTHHVPAQSQQATISDFVLRESALADHRKPHANPRPIPPPAPIAQRIYIPQPNPVVPSDAIENIFPSADSKRLFHHVRSRTSHIIVAYGTNDGMTRNPFMSLAMDFMLKNVDTYAQTAFRHALLSLAAAHAHHESLQATPEQRQHMIVRTVKSRRKALINLDISRLKDKGDLTDLVLITCLTIHIRDVSDQSYFLILRSCSWQKLYAETKMERMLRLCSVVGHAKGWAGSDVV
jgi:hypothetical protein